MKTPSILIAAGQIINSAIREKLKAKGHFNTGRLEGSIKSDVKGEVVSGEMFDYGHIVDNGTKPDRIPYNRGSGAKSSKFIYGLTAFFQSRGLSEKEAKSAAFATANVQKKEGMSTGASARFSSTSDRNHFVKDAWTEAESKLDKAMTEGMNEIFDEEYSKQKTETI
ncbi:MAG: hypothetical protein WBA59_03905 [Moheibacter sp.]